MSFGTPVLVEGSYGMLGVVWSHVNVESNESNS